MLGEGVAIGKRVKARRAGPGSTGPGRATLQSPGEARHEAKLAFSRKKNRPNFERFRPVPLLKLCLQYVAKQRLTMQFYWIPRRCLLTKCTPKGRLSGFGHLFTVLRPARVKARPAGRAGTES